MFLPPGASSAKSRAADGRLRRDPAGRAAGAPGAVVEHAHRGVRDRRTCACQRGPGCVLAQQRRYFGEFSLGSVRMQLHRAGGKDGGRCDAALRPACVTAGRCRARANEPLAGGWRAHNAALALSHLFEQELLQRQAAPQQMEKVEYMPVQYVEAPATGKQAQAVRFVEVPQGTKLVAAPRGRQQGRVQKVEYVEMPQQARRAAPRRAVRRQQLRIGGAGVKPGMMLDGDEPAAEGDEPAAEEAPAAVTPPTPEEIAKALQRIQERQIQEQTFHDTLVDAQTGQPLHVPGVAGSAHNGVSGIGIPLSPYPCPPRPHIHTREYACTCVRMCVFMCCTPKRSVV